MYSSFFDPSHFTSMEGIEISSQISSQKGLSLIAIPLDGLNIRNRHTQEFEERQKVELRVPE